MINDLALIKKNLIRIENLKTWLVDIPKIHPDNEVYEKLWSKYTLWSIEGLWGYDMGGWRYMPGTLFFYGNFFSILDVDELQNVRRYIRPRIRDLDWMIHYAYLECQGFRGWSDDDEYTSDYNILKYTTATDVPRDRLDLINSKGQLKKFITPRENITKLHNSNKGVPLYGNPCQNLQIFGSRGTGKSFSIAGISGQHLTFDGLKYFTEEDFNNPPTIEICVGAGQAEKSSEWCIKLEDGLKAFGTDNDLGVWGRADRGDEDYTPNPFYRDWLGSLDSGNKKNPFRYEYQAKIGNRWVKGLGTKSKLIHVNYSDKKQGGEAAAAGGRYILTIYEEVGLMANIINAWFSNLATVSNNGKQFGVQVAIGTSGNIELVQQSKKMFHNPREYNCIEYDDYWEDSGKIGLFIPCYLSNNTFKDHNGNTDIDAALTFYAGRRIEASSMSDPDVLRYEKMNYPIVPSDMWISPKGHYFPVGELLEWEKKLIKHDLYKEKVTSIKLNWDSQFENGVRREVDLNAEPFYAFPYTRDMTALDGAIQIYQEPQKLEGKIPDDMYYFVFDPYVADNIDEGGSLGAFYGFMNPKYTMQGYNGGTMVCSYIGKHPDGREGYHNNIEKIIAYYGNCPRSLWYENNRGDFTRGYFLKKKKMHLLAFTPQKEHGSNVYERKVASYGIPVSNSEDKLQLISDTSDYLLQFITFNGKQVRGYETIYDIFLVRQLISFEIKKHKNFDAVSAFILAPFVARELEHTRIEEAVTKNKHNPLAALSLNPHIFKDEDIRARISKFNKKHLQSDFYDSIYDEDSY